MAVLQLEEGQRVPEIHAFVVDGSVRMTPVSKRILLLPGFSCDGDCLAELHQALTTKWPDRPVTVADFSGDETLERMAMNVSELVSDAPAILVGLSMGGWVAQAVAASRNDRVRAMILMSSWTRAEPSYLEIVRTLHERIRGGERLRDLRTEVRAGFHDPARADRLADRWLAMAERTGTDAFLRQTAAILANPDVSSFARAVRCPTLAIAGANDGLVSPSSQRDAAGLLSARFELVQRSGHNVDWERPNEVERLVVGWLAGIEDDPALPD